MPENRNHPYEILVLFPQSAASDLQGCADHVRDLLERAGVQLLALRKWDERRLAYDIRGNKRGLYFLAYFRGPGTALASIERDLNLSERVLRHLILRVDEMTDEQMLAADGREQLADEVRLRREGGPEAGAETSTESGSATATAVDTEIVPVEDDAGE